MGPHRTLPLLLLALSLPLPAVAQVNPFRGSNGTPLKADDLTALNDATMRLLNQPQLKAGASESWNTPATGISGHATAGQALTRKGLACRAMNYVINGPAHEKPRKGALTWCKTLDGWRLG